LAFYDFGGKTVVSVGAGGGQMIAYAEPAKKVIAIDCDDGAVARLKDNLQKGPYLNKFDVMKADFYDVSVKGDVVLFEICLHEMTDPVLALKKAKSIAKDVVVYDHLPGRWSFYTAETEKVERSWKAVHTLPVRKEAKFDAIQVFKDYNEIYEKLKVLGEPSASRIKEFLNTKDFTIPMPYAMALI
jgi:SAM-dependent methyltransferase